jgi:endonuclease-3 related protein
VTPAVVFQKLQRAYGPRGWWPITRAGKTSPEYRPDHYKPATRREATEIAVGAILTQNTSWSNVEKGLAALHEIGGVDFPKIRRMPAARLQKLIRPTGYFIQKAKKLKYFAQHVRLRGDVLAWLRKTPLNELRQDLLSIHGVGPETADSIMLYAGGRATFVVDTYTKRIGSRLGWYPAKSPYDDVKNFWIQRLPESVRVYNECHALLVELAKRACHTKPDCGACPLRRGCPVGREI